MLATSRSKTANWSRPKNSWRGGRFRPVWSSDASAVNGRLSRIGTKYHLVPGPPSPCWLQNLVNKRFKFCPCARSLSLQELHAKSRQHGTYPWRPWPALPDLGLGLKGRERAGEHQRARFSKITYYLKDNVMVIHIIHLERRSVNKKTGLGQAIRP
jgi:hypothetical protein